MDILGYAFADFASNKFKTMMSSLGIIIGVMAIVVMLTLGDGLYSGVSDQFGDLQLDTMFILPIDTSVQQGTMSFSVTMAEKPKPPAKFTDRDVNLLRTTEGVKEVQPKISVSGNVTYGADSRRVTVQGIIPQYEDKMAESVDKGRFLSPSDKNSVILGSKVANGTFGKVIRPGSYITISNFYTGESQTYTVAGVLKEMNGSILTGDPNSYIYMTTEGIKGFSDQDTYTEIWVQADSVETATEVGDRVSETLKKFHRNEGYTVLTQKMFASAINQIFDLIKYTLAGIGAVSLLVGGIGIMNVMMLTVKERVKEIGLMKAVGATTTDVRLIFLTESALLGFISGLIGVGIAVLVAGIVGSLAQLPMDASAQNILLGIAFGLFTTTIAGVYPANQASKLDPIEALRTE
nr:ABC transporter permease [Methanocella sp. CWC-04]